MKKIILPLLSFAFASISFSQNLCFNEIHPVSSLPGNNFNPAFNDVSPNQSFVSDFNMDGNPDLLVVGTDVSGTGPGGTSNLYIYLNDGTGQFTPDPANQFSVTGMQQRMAGVGDIDGDSDDDILVLSEMTNQSFLYRNDGTGTFTVVSGSVFESIELMSYPITAYPQFVDVDGDSDKDIFLGSRLFLNNGTGNFSETTALSDLSTYIQMTTLDVDNDGDPDAVVTGRDVSSVTIARIYLNDGAGNFSISASSSSLIPAEQGFISSGDIDNDGDFDLIITGMNTTTHTSPTHLYTNDGAGNFTLVSGTPFLPSGMGEVRFADINNDNYEDVLLTGGNFVDTMTMNFPPCYTNYYLNDGNGNFMMATGTSIDGIFGTVSVADFNGDGLKETFISGGNVLSDATIMVSTKMYEVEFCLPPAIQVNTFVTPSTTNECTGTVTITVQGTPDFTFDLQNGSPAITSTSNQITIDSLCPGIYSLYTADGNGDTLTSIFVIPSDSTYQINNPFGPSSPVLGQLSVTVENCDIDYASIVSAEIDTFTFISQDSVLINWAITDANGTTIIPAIYDLSAGDGNYYLQLELYCPQKSIDQYFVVTEGVVFNNGTISLGIRENKTLSVSIAPNPANDLITIQLIDAENADLTIVDLQGKVILSKHIQNNEKVSVSNFNSGIYLFNISSKNGKSISRVIKY